MIRIKTDIEDFIAEYERIREDLLSDLVDAMQSCKPKRDYFGLILSIILLVLVEVTAILLFSGIAVNHPVIYAIILLVCTIFAANPMITYLFKEPDEDWKKYSLAYTKYKKELNAIDALELLTSDTELESRAKKTYEALKDIEKLKDKNLEKFYITNNELVVNDVVFTDFHAEIKGMEEVLLNYIDNRMEIICH